LERPCPIPTVIRRTSTRECLLLAAEINQTLENGQTPSDADLAAADEACEETGRILGL
jgi:hypothetical protein